MLFLNSLSTLQKNHRLPYPHPLCTHLTSVTVLDAGLCCTVYQCQVSLPGLTSNSINIGRSLSAKKVAFLLKNDAKQTRHKHPCQYASGSVNISINTHLMTQGSVQTLSFPPPPIGVATKPSKKRKVADETPSKAMMMDEPSALDSPNAAKPKLASIAVP